MIKYLKKVLGCFLTISLVLSLFSGFGVVNFGIAVKAEDFYLDHCDAVAGWQCSSGGTISLNTSDKQEGTGSVQNVGTSTDHFKKVFNPTINSWVSESNGYLEFWYYISDASKLSSTSGQIEIGSGGIYDTDEYHWTWSSGSPSLVTGWNYISLKISDATKQGAPNLQKINWFRMYRGLTANVTTKIDGLHFEEGTAATLDLCDVTTGWQGSSISLDTFDMQEGTASVKNVGSGTEHFKKSFSTPVNSGVTESTGYLRFWYYISDVTQLSSSSGQIEIGSSGTSDANEYNWTWPAKTPGLKTGWNFISLKISDATKLGSPNLSSINWFRIYRGLTASVTTKIDDIYFSTDSSTLFDQCEIATGWQGSTVSLNTSDFKEGKASVQTITSNTDHLRKVFSPAVNARVSESEGYLKFWYYISDVTQLSSSSGQIEISSSGTSDANEYNWTWPAKTPGLVTGWNYIVLKLSEATKVGTPDLTSINWFRIYRGLNAGVTIKIDDLRFAADPSIPASSIPTSNLLSIIDYGATPNDTTDDQIAIVNCINAAQVLGKAIYIPDGTFRHSSTLSLSGVSVKGASRDNAILLATDPNAGAIRVTGNLVTLCNFRHQYNTTVERDGVNSKDGIYIFDATKYIVDNVRITKATCAGILTDNGSDGLIQNCYVENTNADGIHNTYGTNNLLVQNNTVYNTGDDTIAVVSYNGTGTCHDITIKNNSVSGGHSRGITVVGGTNITIDTNTVASMNGAGVLVATEPAWDTQPVSNVTVNHCNIQQCGLVTGGHTGILLSGLNGNINNTHITNTTSINNSQGNYRTEGDVTNTVLSGNTGF